MAALTYEYNQTSGLTIAIVDPRNTLHLITYSGKSSNTKANIQFENNIKHVTFISGLMVCLTDEEGKFFVRDLTNDNDDKPHHFEDARSINFVDNKTMVIFSGD